VHVGFEGFWGGLVPENAYNASVLEDLLAAGALGLKVRKTILFRSRKPFHLVMI
jgi:hypothetical protein